MPSSMRNELSQHSKYHVNKHRYLELKHFCMQYRQWKSMLNELSIQSRATGQRISGGNVSDPTEALVERRQRYLENIQMVDKACRIAGQELESYLKVAVTNDRGYTYLRTVMNIPCCKDVYYDIYRKFFWLLDKMK